VNKNIIAVISFLVPVIGMIIFFVNLKKDRQTAFFALIWAMSGMALALAVLLVGTAIRMAA
jgi:uncharacterized membrane protein